VKLSTQFNLPRLWIGWFILILLDFSWCDSPQRGIPLGFSQDSLFLKTGSIETGVILRQTPRLIYIQKASDTVVYKRILVQRIVSNSNVAPIKVKRKSDRDYKKYQNYAVDLNSLEMALLVDPLIITGISAKESQILNRSLISSLENTSGFTVLDSNLVKSIRDEQMFRNSDLCHPKDCPAEWGRLFGADGVISGTIHKNNEEWNITLALVKVDSGHQVNQASTMFRGSFDEFLKQTLPSVVEQCLRGKVGQTPKKPKHSGIPWLVLSLGVLIGVGGISLWVASNQ